MARKRFADYASNARDHQNFTQQKLSEVISCAPLTISRIERGINCPSRRLFNAYNRALGGLGLTYDEVRLESLIEIHSKASELLKAIRRANVKEIEKNIYRFKELMEEERGKDLVADNMYLQYYQLAHLVENRVQGLNNGEYLAGLQEIFKITRDLPDYKAMEIYNYSEIEYELLYMIANTYMKLGNIKLAEKMLQSLMRNDMCVGHPLIKERYLMISVKLARIFFMQREYVKNKECMKYALKGFSLNIEYRQLHDFLNLQLEICKNKSDTKGERLISDFFKVSNNLNVYLNNLYERGKNEEG